MPLLLTIMVFAALGGIASAAVAVVFLWVREEHSVLILPHFISFATGALLGAALLALLPEAIAAAGPSGAHAIGLTLIAAASLGSLQLGALTTLAVAAHEIPHRAGDFAILVQAGLSRLRALLLNLATGIASVLGAVVAYFGLRETQHALPYALAFAAAGFLYIAVAGLIPGLHRRADPRTSAIQVTLIAAGIGVIACVERLTGQ